MSGTIPIGARLATAQTGLYGARIHLASAAAAGALTIEELARIAAVSDELHEICDAVADRFQHASDPGPVEVAS